MKAGTARTSEGKVGRDHHASASFASFAVHRGDIVGMRLQPRMHFATEGLNHVQPTRIVIIEREAHNAIWVNQACKSVAGAGVNKRTAAADRAERTVEF